MGKIWKTLKAGALAILLSTVSPNAAYTAPTRPAPAQKGENDCTRLETIAKREAAGIPREYAKASYELADNVHPKYIKYKCTVTRKNSDGSFNQNRSYDLFEFIEEPEYNSIHLANLLNIVSEVNIARNHPPLSDAWVTYAVQANLGYAAKKHNLKIAFDKSYLKIYRYDKIKFKVPVSMKDWDRSKIAELKYSEAGLPKGVKGPCGGFSKKLPGHICLPLFPEAIVPYALLQPKRETPAPRPAQEATNPAKRATETPSPRPAQNKTGGQTKNQKKITLEEWNLGRPREARNVYFNVGFGFLSHRAIEMIALGVFEIGYENDRWGIGVYGTAGGMSGTTARDSIVDQYGNVYMSEYHAVSGSVGLSSMFQFRKHFRLKPSAGFAWHNIKEIEVTDSMMLGGGTPAPDLKTYKLGTSYGLEAGIDFCVIFNEKPARNSICLGYRIRYMFETQALIDSYQGKWKNLPQHGGVFTTGMHF